MNEEQKNKKRNFKKGTYKIQNNNKEYQKKNKIKQFLKRMNYLGRKQTKKKKKKRDKNAKEKAEKKKI